MSTAPSDRNFLPSEKDEVDLPDLLTAAEVAALLELNVVTVRRLARERQIRVRRLGSGRNGGMRFTRADVREYLDRKTQPPAPLNTDG